jgi:hypothetical protein
VVACSNKLDGKLGVGPPTLIIGECGWWLAPIINWMANWV